MLVYRLQDDTEDTPPPKTTTTKTNKQTNNYVNNYAQTLPEGYNKFKNTTFWETERI